MDAVSADQAYDSFEGLKDIQRVLARRLVDSGALNESILEKYDFIFRFKFGTWHTARLSLLLSHVDFVNFC